MNNMKFKVSSDTSDAHPDTSSILSAYHIVVFLCVLLTGVNTGKAWAVEINEANNATHANQRIELQCGQHTVVITCGYEPNDIDQRRGRKCNKNRLFFVNKGGEVTEPSLGRINKVLKDSNDNVDKTPVGFACDIAKNGDYYVEVEFSDCFGNFNSCTTVQLFSENGKRITADETDLMKELAKARRKKKLEHVNFPFIYIEKGE